MSIRSVVRATGHYLPAKIVSNDDLSAALDTSDEWITRRTGIKQRHIALESETTATLATHAALDALTRGNCPLETIDAVIVATSTPDNIFPATATKVQSNLKISKGFAFDVGAACSGFVYALAVADNFIRCQQAKRVLVIGSETFSRIVDWKDRSTCVLFGDGAGALLLEGQESDPHSGRGVLSTHLHADGQYYNLLYVDGGPGSNGRVGYVKMEGAEVFRHAVACLASVVDEALSSNHLTPNDIDWLVPHQANQRIIDSTAKKLNLPPERVVLTVAEHANTSAASIPLALALAEKDGRLKPGQVILLDAMGAGFTWGAAVIRW